MAGRVISKVCVGLQGIGRRTNFGYARFAIIAGAWLDVLDGKLAKLLNQSSDFGAELDSLADLVSFGVAQAVLLVSYYPGDTGLQS